MQKLYEHRFKILACLFIIQCCYFAPGYFMVDSEEQYRQAMLGQYSDHHPPLMSFVWRYLDHIYSGPALMFILQQALIYAAVFVLLKTVDRLPLPNRPLMNLFLLVFPSYPQVLIYETVILKDVQFAFSFLLSGAILAYYTVLKKSPPSYVAGLLLIVMLYGAAVKYQGQFCVIVLAIWLGCLLNLKVNIFKKILAGLIIYSLILIAIFNINNYLVPQTNKENSWQLVKIYDLVAISIAIDTDLIPSFNKLPSYSFKEMKSRFRYPAVDSLVFTLYNKEKTSVVSKPIVTPTQSTENLKLLTNLWQQTVKQHPFLYLRHRVLNFSYIVLSRPGYKYLIDEQNQNKRTAKYANVIDVPYAIINDVPQSNLFYGLIDFVYGTFFYVFMSNLPVIILGLGYWVLSLVAWRYSMAAPVLFGFSSISLLMVGILFFMSMAGTPRYTFISIVMIHAMHVFAYACYTAYKKALNKL